jgi:hypothetical protein
MQRSLLKKLPLLALSIPIIAAVSVQFLWPRRTETVADAQARLDRVKDEMAAVVGVVNSADAVARRTAGTHSPARQAIQSLGQGVIQELGTEKNEASVDVVLAQRVATANCCIQTYKAYNEARQAMAALNLSGIEDVVISPPSRLGAQGRRLVFELMVPSGLTNKAIAALQSTRVAELSRFGDALQGASVVQTLAKHGIRATLCPSQGYVVYVQQADEKSARASLNDSTTVSADKF